MKKLIYLGEDFFLHHLLLILFALYFCFWGFIICVILSIFLPHERKFSYLIVLVTFGNNERLGKIVWIFFEVNSFVFHAWLECPNISCFWSRGG